MNVLNVFGLFAILLKCVVASGDVVGVEFREAVDRGNFGWLNRSWTSWKDRRDLLDYVIAKGADAAVWFIQRVGAKRRGLAALFDKGEEGMIDEVLGRINYGDSDLRVLTEYRHELAGSPEKFFKVLDKIKEPDSQESTVQGGVINLFRAGKRDLVAPLVNALGKRTFKGDRLKGQAIQMAFGEGTERGYQDIVELYCEHHAITSGAYAVGLKNSWNKDKPNQVFPFLLKQADQGDLDEAKEVYADEGYEQFRHAIDTAPKPVPPAGTRHRRPIERAIAKLAMDTLDTVYGTNMWHQEPGSIIEEYLLGEKEKAKGGESEGQEVGTENPTD